MAKAYRPTKEERESTRQRMAKAKDKGITFEDFFEKLSMELPELKRATAYGWWQSASGSEHKTGETPKGQAAKGKPKTDPSEELATLLRKESVLHARVAKAREELAAVQGAISGLWEVRQKRAKQALSNE